MQKAVRIYCCSWNQPNGNKPVFFACHALLLGLVIAGCGGERDPSRSTASAPALASSVRNDLPGPNRMGAQNPILTTGKYAPLATAGKSTVVSVEESARFAQLKALSLLAPLSDRETAGLLKQLPSASPSERLTLINGYPGLAALQERQQQVLLNQLERIVPVSISASLLVCNCSHGIQRKLCVKEPCTNRSELQSLCNQACGTLAAFETQCLTSRQCAEK